jgi:hypothetical protein
MAHPSKAKGDKYERELCTQLAELTGWPVRRKLGAGRADDAGDIDGLPNCCGQAKAYRDIARAVRETLDELPQQHTNAGTTFAAGFIRRPGGKWFTVMTLEQFTTLLREATGPDEAVA